MNFLKDLIKSGPGILLKFWEDKLRYGSPFILWEQLNLESPDSARVHLIVDYCSLLVTLGIVHLYFLYFFILIARNGLYDDLDLGKGFSYGRRKILTKGLVLILVVLRRKLMLTAVYAKKSLFTLFLPMLNGNHDFTVLHIAELFPFDELFDFFKSVLCVQFFKYRWVWVLVPKSALRIVTIFTSKLSRINKILVRCLFLYHEGFAMHVRVIVVV